MVLTSPVNEASPHIMDGFKNIANPDLPKLADELRQYHAQNADILRNDAPVAIAKAALWILENAEILCDMLESDVAQLPMSRPMLREAFKNCVTRWTDVERLRALVREECSTLGPGRPLVPKIVFHNLAGNLFLSGWESITHATLLGAASIVRCSNEDRVFPGIWARAIAAADSRFSHLVTICEWHSHDSPRFLQATELADAVVSFGADQSVQALKQSTAWHKPFTGHGATVSFALLTADALQSNPADWLAERIAYDFAVYDQQGCLSPRALFIEERKPREVDRFVDALYNAARQIQAQLPRVELTLEDKAAQARQRDDVLLDAACGGSSRRVSTDADPFLITVRPISQFRLGLTNRYFDIYLIKDLNELIPALASLSGMLSTLAVADPRRLPHALLNSIEFTRICTLGSMQTPPLVWCLDGIRPLQKLLRQQSVQLPD